MTFDECLEFILDAEGGYVHHASDPGGETKFGISKRSYPHLDIKSLTLAQASAIYSLDFWHKYQIHKLPAWVRLAYFDAAVNHGPEFAALALQISLGVKPDGVIGPKTYAAMNRAEGKDVLHKYLSTRLAKYARLKTWPVFGVGWCQRLLDLAHRVSFNFLAG